MKLVSTELVIHKTMCGQKFEAGLIEMHIKSLYMSNYLQIANALCKWYS